MSNIKGKDALAISTNFCYVLADLMETNLMDLVVICFLFSIFDVLETTQGKRGCSSERL